MSGFRRSLNKAISFGQSFKSLGMPGLRHHKLNFVGSGVIIKPFPVYDPEINQLTPTLTDIDGETDLGDWMRCYPVVQLLYAGSKIRFIPFDYSFQTEDEISLNPVLKLRQAILGLREAGTLPKRWEPLFSKPNELYKNAVIPITYDAQNYFLLCSIVMENNRYYNPPLGGTVNSPLCLLHLSKTAGLNLRDLVLKAAPDLLNSNKFVAIIPVPGGESGTSYRPSSYDVRVASVPGEFETWDYSPVIESIMSRKISWRNIIQLPSIEQQMNYLCNGSIPMSAIVYALSDSLYANAIPAKYIELGTKMLEEDMRSLTPGSSAIPPFTNTPNVPFGHSAPNIPNFPSAPSSSFIPPSGPNVGSQGQELDETLKQLMEKILSSKKQP